MTLQHTVRITAGAAVTLFALYAATAVQTRSPGSMLLGLAAAGVLAVIAFALLRKDAHRG